MLWVLFTLSEIGMDGIFRTSVCFRKVSLDCSFGEEKDSRSKSPKGLLQSPDEER